MRERSLSVARMQARRMAWHSIATRACMMSSSMSGCWARQNVRKSPKTPTSALRTKAPLPWRMSRKPRLASDRKASLSTGRDTPRARQSSLSPNSLSPTLSAPDNSCSRKKERTFSVPASSSALSDSTGFMQMVPTGITSKHHMRLPVKTRCLNYWKLVENGRAPNRAGARITRISDAARDRAAAATSAAGLGYRFELLNPGSKPQWREFPGGCRVKGAP